jgi:hypothetical protein
VTNIGRKTRREAAHGAKAGKPKRYEPRLRLQDSAANRPTFAAAAANAIRHRLRPLCRARMLVQRVEREMPTRRSGANMNSIAAALVIRERLRQRLLPPHEAWRCQGEYAGGCLCDGCGERITSAQASYEVDFSPGITPESVKLHRACFEIWLHEGESQTIS